MYGGSVGFDGGGNSPGFIGSSVYPPPRTMAHLFAATVLTGILLFAVVLYMMRGMKWRSYDLTFGQRERSGADVLADVVAHPATWGLGFLVLVSITTVIALTAVGALPLPLPGGVVGIAAAFGALIVVFLVFGTYGMMRSRNASYAESVAMSLFLLGILFAIAITANLAVA